MKMQTLVRVSRWQQLGISPAQAFLCKCSGRAHPRRRPWWRAAAVCNVLPLSTSVCKAWAIFKGKYKEGDTEGPAIWKTRLRCALNKSPEFEEVPENSHRDGAEPYKVYRLLPPGTLPGECPLAHHS